MRFARLTAPATLALALLAAPLTGEAQPAAKIARIGYLSSRSGPSAFDKAFKQGLRELGYVEGVNVTIEYRWAAFGLDRLPDLAADLVRLKVDLIVATGGAAVGRAAKSASRPRPTRA